jgi:glycosyltransferase involved in cell wall biosynthesis
LLVVIDGMGATQQITFTTPLEAWRRAGVVRIKLIDERALSRLGEAGAQEVREALAAEMASFRPTALIMSRYAGPEYPILFELAREAGIPVICHLDDDLFEVPITLGVELYLRYRHPQRVHALYRIAEAADLVYVSTPELGRRVQQRLKPKRLMVAGIYVGAEAKGTPAPAADADGRINIGYMASAGHAFDLELAAPAIRQVTRRFPQVRFHLFGSICRAPVAEELGSDVVRHRRVEGAYEDFRKTMSGLGWQIGLAPLRDHPFNGCKAPTKWLEYADAGFPTLASDHPVYRPLAAEGALALCGDANWEQALTDLVLDPERRLRLAQRALDVVRRDYTWSRVEQQMIDLLAVLSPHAPSISPPPIRAFA